MTIEIISQIAKWMIGLGFLWIPIWLVWLYYHRHGDWPKSWTLLLIGICMASCGASRITHAIDDEPDTNPFTVGWDVSTAVVIFIVDILIPFIISQILGLPTPREWEHAQRAKMQRDQLQFMIARETENKEKAEQRANAMKAMLSEYSAIDPELKAKMLKIMEEL